MPEKFSPLHWTPELVRKFWDYHGQFSEEFFADQVGTTLIKSIGRYLGEKSAILDYGCGSGALIGKLLSMNLSAAGTDYSPDLVNTVNQKFHNCPTFLGAFPIEELLNRAQRYDVIFATEIIEHLDDERLLDFIRHIKALLLPHGRLILTTRNEENLAASYVFCPNCEHFFHRMQHVRSWSPSALSAFLTEHDLAPLRVYVTDLSALSSLRPWVRLRSWIKRLLNYPGSTPNLIAIATPKGTGE